MIWVVLLLALICLVVIALYFIGSTYEEPDPEELLETAIRLHEIQRELDTDQIKVKQREDALRIRREIQGAMEKE